MKKVKSMDIVFEDKWLLVVNKPAGLVVNRSETNTKNTLQDDISEYFHLENALGIGDRAGIVHRLDRETSGLLIVAKTTAVFLNLQAQFKNREVAKVYIALVHGNIVQNEGVVDTPIIRIGKFGKFGVASLRQVGREAKTEFKVDSRYELPEDYFILNGANVSKPRLNYLKVHAKKYTLLSVFPKTGRTHQIRVHLKSIGNPVVSDLIYGPGKLLKFDLVWCPRLFLHAANIQFTHPKTKKLVDFRADLPKDLKDAILNLNRL